MANIKSPRTEDLTKLVADLIASTPHHHDGFAWAAAPQALYCSELGISPATLRRLIGRPPFVRERVQIDGRVTTLLRTGASGPKTKRHVQNILAQIWRKKTGRRITPVGYGHLGGLVDAWKKEKAADILKLVLDDWTSFMAGVQIEIALLGDDGYHRRYDYPSSSVILRFNTVGIEMYCMDQQEKYGMQADYAGFDQAA